MTNPMQFTKFVGLGLTALVLAACGGGGSSGGSGTGLMSLAVTDSPIDDAKRVVVRFTHIELKPRDGDRVLICLDGEDAYVEESPRGRVSCPPAEVREIDLLALQGEDSAFLFEDLEVPAGEYSWIRFYLEPDEGASAPPLSNFATSSFIEFGGEYRENLIIPGGLQAGLQLVSGFTVPEDGLVSFTVDFDLRNAIRKDDEFPGYHRMRRALRLVDNSNVGVITGTVNVGSYAELSAVAATCTEDLARCPGLSVFVYEAGEANDPPLTTASVRHRMVNDGEYRYTVGFLSEGSYDLRLMYEVADALRELDAVNDVGVVAGAKTVVDFQEAD